MERRIGSFMIVLCFFVASAMPVFASEGHESMEGFSEHHAMMGEEHEGPEAEASVSLLSQYNWRGWQLSKDSMVVQPCIEVAYNGFSIELWGNLDTDLYREDFEIPDHATHEEILEIEEEIKAQNDRSNYNETEFTLAYEHDFGIASAKVGYIYYALSFEPDEDDSQEFFVSGTLNVLLSPTLTVYRDFAHYPGTYIRLDLSHSIALPRDISLDMAFSASYLDSDDYRRYADPDSAEEDHDEYSNFHDGKIALSMPIPLKSFIHTTFARYLTITPEINWVFPLSGDASKEMAHHAKGETNHNNFVYGGAKFTFSF